MAIIVMLSSHPYGSHTGETDADCSFIIGEFYREYSGADFHPDFLEDVSDDVNGVSDDSDGVSDDLNDASGDLGTAMIGDTINDEDDEIDESSNGNPPSDSSEESIEQQDFYVTDEPFMIYQMDGKPRPYLRIDEDAEMNDPSDTRYVYNLAKERMGQIIGELPDSMERWDRNDPSRRSLSPDDSDWIPPHSPSLFATKYYYTLPEAEIVDGTGTRRPDLRLVQEDDGMMVYGQLGPIARPQGNLPDRLVGVSPHPHHVKFYYEGDGSDRKIYNHLGHPRSNLTKHPFSECVLDLDNNCCGWLEGELTALNALNALTLVVGSGPLVLRSRPCDGGVSD